MAAGTDRATLTGERCALRLEVRGIVQGVGFRPFVYRLAHEQALGGWVRNTSWGVEIAVEGPRPALEAFAAALAAEAPPLAQIASIQRRDAPAEGHAGFAILASAPQPGAYQPVSPDVATCPDCLRELLDPANRRYRYPFTNCTNCGPRFTIIADVPYDRPQTTMQPFAMCPACQREYDDPLDRRFHAQPNACPVCGPQLALVDADGTLRAERDEALRQAAALLRAGGIVALKGLGGYQLACDATDAAAVARLRARKRRPHKPFAVMMADLASLEAHVTLNAAERELLTCPAAPIVLASWLPASTVAPEVAPHTRALGVMLPNTPLHHLLLRDVGRPLVMTSGNLSEEPIAREDAEARERLGGIADALLCHNRRILSRLDDSVWFVPGSGPQPVRRARGYAPQPIALPVRTRPILAVGAELKNTFCLARDELAFLSQHIGDMENLETADAFAEAVALYERLFHVAPVALAHDLHPDYLASRVARANHSLPAVGVQHHHAHLAACLAEHGVLKPVIGVVLDGAGYGRDGHTWGGEVLVGDARGVVRAAQLEYLPLPGGDAATRKPYRLALAYWRALLGARPLPESLRALPPQEHAWIARLAAPGARVPLTSSAGRLFDAVSALLGVRQEVSYEAQAAIELEMIAAPGEAPAYPFRLEPAGVADAWGAPVPPLAHATVVRLAPLWEALADDLEAGVPVAQMALRFHVTLAEVVAALAWQLRDVTGLERVALSGGCFQNRLLLDRTAAALARAGFGVLTHALVPSNDGGLALGQALIAHYTLERG